MSEFEFDRKASPLAHDLDRAGITGWRQRLRDARARDVEEYLRGVVRAGGSHFDREWTLVKEAFRTAEYRTATTRELGEAS